MVVQFYRSFCGKSRQSRGVRSGDNFQRSLFNGHDRVTTNVGLGARLLAGLGWAIGWVGPELAFAGPLLGVSCGSDPHARLELKLIAAAARCPNRSLGQPPRWLLRNDS